MTSKTDGSVSASYVEAQIRNRACKTLRQAPSKSAPRSQIRECRSFLLAPVSHPGRFRGARAEGGDGIIVDLKSTVSLADKQQACDAALAFFRHPQDVDFVRMLRINSPHRTPQRASQPARAPRIRRPPNAVVIPKCEIGGNHTTRPEMLGGTRSTIGIVPMVERARASFIADDMAKAHERVCGLFFGGGNLTTDPDAEGSWGKLALARSWIGAAAVSIRITVVFTRSLEAVPRAGPVMAAYATSGAGTPDLAGEILCR